MKISEVPRYLLDKYRLEVTRQTVYNWTNIGLRGMKLPYQTIKGKPTAKYPQVRIITEAQLDEFLHNCGVELSGSRSGEAGGGPAGTTPGGPA